MLRQFTVYDPIKIEFLPGRFHYLYYKDSRIFSELKEVLNNLVESFMSEVALNSSSVPVIITNNTHHKVIMYGNLDKEKMKDSLYVEEKT